MNAGISMRDTIISCTVGTIGTKILVDPNENEQYDIANELVISYLPRSKSIDCL